MFFRVIFRFYLLCEDCNLEFLGFAVPSPPRHAAPKRKPKSDNKEPENASVENASENDSLKVQSEQETEYQEEM